MAYVPIPRPALGGDIIGILVRRKARLKAMQASRQADQYTPPKAWLGDIPISVKSQESYAFNAEATQHAVESGAIFSDHIILHPVKVVVSAEVTNWERGSAQNALQLIEQLWRNRLPVELMTEHKILKDMFLISFEADNSIPNWGALTFRATFQQIKLVKLQTASVPPEKVAPTAQTGGPETPKSIESPVDTGNVSLLANTFDWAQESFGGAR
jgi:hypothetical protein